MICIRLYLDILAASHGFDKEVDTYAPGDSNYRDQQLP